MKKIFIASIAVFLAFVFYFFDFWVDKDKYINFRDGIEDKLETAALQSIPRGIKIEEYSYLSISKIQDHSQTKNILENFIKDERYKAISLGCFDYPECVALIKEVVSNLKESHYKTNKYITFIGPKIYQEDLEVPISDLGARFLFVEFNYKPKDTGPIKK